MTMHHTFDSWWYEVGSGIRPLPDADYETHGREVARRAFEAGKEAAAQQRDPSIDHALNSGDGVYRP